VEETGEPLETVRRRDDHEQHGQRHQDQQAGVNPAGRADHPEQGQENDQQDERGTEVVTGHHQQAQHAGAGHQRHQQVPPVGQLAQFLLAGQQIGPPQQQRELGQLRRLELQPAELDPPGRAVLGHPDAVNQGQPQPDHRHREHRVGQGTEQPG
jgi:hypothetical protein